MANVSVVGLATVSANLAARIATLIHMATIVTEVSATTIYATSQGAVAVDTGELRDSGTMEPFQDGQVTGFTISYGDGIGAKGKTYSYSSGNATNQAAFVEWGTRFMPPRPYLFPSWEQEVPHWLDALNAL